ncbi:MAG: 5'-deoxyadenosine deaminase [Vicinamibacterales bacterium]|jgi:5-methylthioadenosine/S-adenosylhomocysteine deaminase|nr:5'-deoxyadenosine deaminase [Vicinamibacterales bacterium]
MASLLIRGGTVLTMNDRLDIVDGDVLVRDGRIEAVGRIDAGRHDTVLDASAALVMPGFIQTHIHLCQTLFRGAADDLALIDWLRTRIWPMEAAHTPASLRASARLAVCELLSSGTTSVLTMETVHDTEAVFEEVAASGMRAVVGKCLMDEDAAVPRRLLQSAREAIDESLDLHRRWDGAAGGRIRAAFAPRFAVSCSQGLLEEVGALSSRHDVIVHTHASEQQAEIAIVERRTGKRNIEYFEAIGLASERLCVAHCVWVDQHEQDILASRRVKVLHCPGSNLKLGSGLAPIAELRRRGISVSLGADGAACNNRLDMFEEMRLAAVLQAVRLGPGALPARDAVWMATREGARALGLEAEIGSVEPGKRADLIVVGLDRPHLAPGGDPYSTLVYAARGTDVRHTVVDGEVLVRDSCPVRLDPAEVTAGARREAAALLVRAGI